jgi:hypothetical protein
VFVRVDKVPRLAGINTFNARPEGSARPAFTFGTRGGGQLLAPHRNWIESVVRADSSKR